MRVLLVVLVMACSGRGQGESAGAVKQGGPPGPEWGVTFQVVTEDEELARSRKLEEEQQRELIAELLRAGGRLVAVATAVDIGPKPAPEDEFFVAQYDVEQMLAGKLKKGRIKVRHPLLPGFIADLPPAPDLKGRYVLFLKQAPQQSLLLLDALRETPKGYYGSGWPGLITLEQLRQALEVKP